ncbi:nose resistant to fluoxetine protein 6-like [Chironomus tepperi]|uniref:nose resistant to fluoxetine protein 6-like n=1 Tax=Chironomus tepperi TaxID=113505 RepID=UPI00391EEAE3
MSCESHLEYFRESYVNQEEWAVKLLDSWTKFSSKPLISTLLNFGPFTDCINFHRNLNSTDINGQHCLISYSSILYHNFDDTSIEYEMDSIIEKETFVLKNGICLPSSCSMSEIENFLRNHLKETDIIVLNTYCQTKEMLSINLLDIFVLFILIALVLITSICTYLDLKYRGKKLNNKFLKAFSAHQNYKYLSKYVSNEQSIECVNGLKVLSAIWIIIGHRMDMIVENSNVIREFMSSEEKFILRISEMFTSVVDIFFLISGMLVTMKCLRLFKENNFSFIKHCASRFLRFVPALAIIIAFFMSTWPKILANGPQTFEFKDELEDCRRNWMRSLLLVGNINGNFCLRHTWYTSTDFQLFIISPAIVYGLFKFKRKFLKIIAFIIVVGQINIFVHKLRDNHEEFYYEAYYRFMPWFIGIMLGYVLENTQSAKGIEQDRSDGRFPLFR